MSRNVLAARRASVNASASLLEAARRWRPAVRDDWLSRVAGALPRHDTAHAALLADILDVVHGAHPRRPKTGSSAVRRAREMRLLAVGRTR
jgi:hypothetical protein